MAEANWLMVVDDEPLVLNVMLVLLKNAGYQVLGARNANEAIDLLHAHDGTIVLAVVDLTLPDMNGARLVDALARIRPELRMVVASGQSTEVLRAAAKHPNVRGWLAKPFRGEQLVQAVREALG